MALNETLKDHVLTLEISHPERRNTLDKDMLEALAASFARASNDADVRAVLVVAQPGIFSAGAELAEELKSAPTEGANAAAAAMIDALATCTKPVVACVEGPAVGLAVTLLYYCDLVYAGSRALFSLPSTALGLTPQLGTVYMALSFGGYHKAAEKILLSEPITAEEALAMRLVTGVFPDDQVRAQAEARAERLARLSPAAVQSAKALLRAAVAEPLAASRALEAERYAALRGTPEAQEACTAFLEGRKPSFK